MKVGISMMVSIQNARDDENYTSDSSRSVKVEFKRDSLQVGEKETLCRQPNLKTITGMATF